MANTLQGEVEEARALPDLNDRDKRQNEAELGDAGRAIDETGALRSLKTLKTAPRCPRLPSTLPCRQRKLINFIHCILSTSISWNILL